MRWNSIKSVMIAILLGVNLWLMYLLFGRYAAYSYFDETTLRNTAEILGRDGIAVAVEQIDARRRDAALYAAPMPEEYHETVATAFTHSPIAEGFPTPTGRRMIAENGDTVTITGTFGVNYLAAGQNREQMAESVEWALGLLEPIAPKQRSLRDLRERLSNCLTANSHDNTATTPAGTRIRYDAAYRFGEYTLLVCSQAIDGKPIAGHTVRALFDGAGTLVWLDGVWSFLPITGSYSAPLYDQINILFTERSARLSEAGEEEVSLTLSSMTFCYVLTPVSDGEGRTVYYSPAWQIAYTDGSTVTYSAVTGEAVPGV